MSLAPNAKMLDGVSVKMMGEEFTIPPLNFAQIKKLQPVIAQFTAVKTGTVFSIEQIEGISKVVHAAMSRNYPQITLEEVEEMIDLTNAETVINAVMNNSGFVRPEGETMPVKA